MQLERLKELLIERCDPQLKEEATALFFEIKEALREAHLESARRRIDALQEIHNLKDGARILPENFDDAIVGSDRGLLVYSAGRCVAILQLEMLEAIAQGDLDLYGDDMSAQDSAWTYATEHYEFNVSGDLSPTAGPVFLEDRFRDE